MNKKRVNTSVTLMLLAIVAVLGFQVYWLYNNYNEEKRVLRIRTNALFHETVRRVEIEKLKLDTNAKFKITAPRQAMGMVDVIRRRVDLDTLTKAGRVGSATIISMNEERGRTIPFESAKAFPGDSLRQTVRVFRSTQGKEALVQILAGVDSLQDSVTVKEITDRYAKVLTSEKVNIGFTVSRKELEMGEDVFPEDFERNNEVTSGFFRPFILTLEINNTARYLFKKLSIPILVSFLLVGITILSFLFMWRNLHQQRKLARLKNEFVSNITHELKTPIATVGVAIEALRNFNAMNDPERTREYLDISAAEVHRLGLLVDKVLKLSMFENREIGLQKESFDLLQLTQEVLASMKLQFEKQEAKVTLETDGMNFIIEADKLHITSVVYNLLDNALKYSKKKPEIDVVIKSHREHVSLTVSDKGIGIAKEYKGKIFEKFFRIPGGDRHNVKGYGLGLSYVNHIVKKHMGYVEVKSELGEGSTFIVNIPYKEADIVHFNEHRTIRREAKQA